MSATRMHVGSVARSPGGLATSQQLPWAGVPYSARLNRCQAGLRLRALGTD